MPISFSFESKNYKKNITFGPGLRFRYVARLKTTEEFRQDRRKERSDVYVGDEFIGKNWRHSTNKWNCYIRISDSTITHTMILNKMREFDSLNKFIKDKYSKFTGFTGAEIVGGDAFICWVSHQRGICIRDKIIQEVCFIYNTWKEYEAQFQSDREIEIDNGSETDSDSETESDSGLRSELTTCTQSETGTTETDLQSESDTMSQQK